MKTRTKFHTLLLFLPLALIFGAGAVLSSVHSVLVESRESKTESGGAVFNRISFYADQNEDIWMMQQSHHGIHAKPEDWENLGIRVVRTQTPKIARFYQLKPGPLRPDLKWNAINYRVSCFLCHTNGPRAIRPVVDSIDAPLSWQNRVRLALWNLKIKTYGHIETREPNQAISLRPPTALVPIRFPGHFQNEELKSTSCVRCHQNGGLINRGFLTRQNALTIRFMTNQGEMPPFPFILSPHEKKEIEAFLDGL